MPFGNFAESKSKSIPKKSSKPRKKVERKVIARQVDAQGKTISEDELEPSESDGQVCSDPTFDEDRFKQLEDKINILNKTLADYRSENANLKSLHEVTKIDYTEINTFTNWVKTIKPDDYPMQKQIINQIKNWDRPSRIGSVLSLYQLYKESKQ